MSFYFFSDVGESRDGKSSRALGWSVEGIGLLTAEPMCRPYPIKKNPLFPRLSGLEQAYLDVFRVAGGFCFPQTHFPPAVP